MKLRLLCVLFCIAMLFSLAGCVAKLPDAPIPAPDVETEGLISETEPEATETESEVTETEPEATETEPEVTETEPEVTETEPEAIETEPEATETEPTETEPEAIETEPMTETEPGTETEPVTFDLFSYCKAFAIERGTLNGVYCIYQQPSTNYGGYENEYFSIAYWADSDMVEFSLHCPLSDTQSHNFYLQMRGGYDGTYEYVSSKYYRDTGESFRYAKGTIDPSLFYDGYPISCDVYEGAPDGQDTFMEDTRVGICDLIRLIKEFVTVENLDCDFSDFGFVNF